MYCTISNNGLTFSDERPNLFITSLAYDSKDFGWCIVNAIFNNKYKVAIEAKDVDDAHEIILDGIRNFKTAIYAVYSTERDLKNAYKNFPWLNLDESFYMIKGYQYDRDYTRKVYNILTKDKSVVAHILLNVENYSFRTTSKELRIIEDLTPADIVKIMKKIQHANYLAGCAIDTLIKRDEKELKSLKTRKHRVNLTEKNLISDFSDDEKLLWEMNKDD